MIWRGWGILVFVIPIVWLGIVCVVWSLLFPGVNPPAADPEFNIKFGRAGAIALVVGAGSLWLITRHRDRVAPDIDHFFYVPTNYWVYILLVGAVAALVAPYFFPVSTVS